MDTSLEYTPRKGLQYSSLKIIFNNFKYDYTYLNTIRRILMEYIPTYAFDRKYIHISKNTNYQNNSQLSLRLSQIPVLGIKTDLVYLDESRYKNIDYLTEKDYSDEKLYEVSINVKNTTKEFISLTTNDFSIFIDGKQIENPYNTEYPLLITRLRPDEEFICNMKAKIRLGILNNIWSPVYNTYFINTNKNNYEFIIHSYGQKTEKELFMQAIDVILDKINNRLKNELYNDKNREQKSLTDYIFELKDKSIANILTSTLEKYDEVLFVGTNIKSFLDPNVDLHLKLKDNTDLDKLLDKCIKDINNIYNDIKKSIEKNK